MEESVFYNLSQDETLGGDSPSIHKIPSQAALKAYIDSKAGSGGPNYFYVEDASGAANTLTIKKSNNGLTDKVFEWSLDKQNWTEITVSDTTGVSLAVPANGRVYLRGDNGTLSDGVNNININCATIFDIGGDLTTLISNSGSQDIIGNNVFVSLFQSSRVRHARNAFLKAKTIGTSACQGMFKQCTSLISGADLQQDNISNYSYRETYSGCTSLTETYPINANKIASYGCFSIYSGCTSLTSVIFLSTELSNASLQGACNGCTALNHVEVHIATWNTSNAANWLNGVAATGDFYNLGGATIPTGTNGIPSGWTEHTQLP